MFGHSWSRVGVALVLAAGLAGCNGKPEDTGQSASSDATTLKTPAPSYPAWSTGMIGKNLGEVSHGTIACKGQIDVVAAKYTGARPGSQIEGWAWNEKDAKPIDEVLLVDSSNRIVGAAVGGGSRTDVKAALPEVKTAAVGWKGVAGITSGQVTAIGLTDRGASCVLSTMAL